MKIKIGVVKAIPLKEAITGLQVCYKGSDGLYYFGKYKEVDKTSSQCQVIMQDGFGSPVLKSELVTLVVEYEVRQFFWRKIVQLPLQFSNWFYACHFEMINSGKEVEFEILERKFAVGGPDFKARLHIIEHLKVYRLRDIIEFGMEVIQAISKREFDPNSYAEYKSWVDSKRL
jgi:hypothetical protein